MQGFDETDDMQEDEEHQFAVAFAVGGVVHVPGDEGEQDGGGGTQQRRAESGAEPGDQGEGSEGGEEGGKSEGGFAEGVAWSTGGDAPNLQADAGHEGV